MAMLALAPPVPRAGFPLSDAGDFFADESRFEDESRGSFQCQ